MPVLVKTSLITRDEVLGGRFCADEGCLNSICLHLAKKPLFS